MDNRTKREATLRQLVEQARRQLGVSKRELYRGVQVSIKHPIVKRDAEAFDRLTWDYMLGRMGISNLVYEGYIYAYEFDLYQLHEVLRTKTNRILHVRHQLQTERLDSVNQDEMRKLIDSARGDIKRYRDMLIQEVSNVITGILFHEFFLRKMEMYLLMGEELLENTSRATERLQMAWEAWKLFHDDEDMETAFSHLTKHFYAPAELECLMIAAGAVVDGGQMQQGERFLQKLWAYRTHHEQDMEEEVKIYPYVAWMLAKVMKQLSHAGAAVLLEQGLEILTRTGRMNGLALILDELLQVPDYIGDRRLLQKQRDALVDVSERAGVDIYIVYPLLTIENAIHVNALIRQKRLERDWTQQQLCEGIISWEWYSKFERERYSPSWEKVSVMLMELNLPYERQWPILDSDDPEVLRAYVACKRYIYRHQYELMDEQYHRVRMKLNQESLVNRQYIYHMEGIIEEEIYVRDYPSRSAEEYEKMMRLTIEQFPEVSYEKMLFGEVEQRLLLDYLFALRDGQRTLSILKRILRGYYSNKNSRFYWRSIQRSMMENYEVFVGLFQNRMSSAKIAVENLKYALKNGDMQGVYREMYGYGEEIKAACPNSSTMKKACEYCFSHALLLAQVERSTFWIKVIKSMR